MFSTRKKRVLKEIKNHYGENPFDTFSASRCRDRLDQIRILHDTMNKNDAVEGNAYPVDDVTWADLEMDEVFIRVNQTQSYIGEQVLYQTLHTGNDAFFRENRELMDTLSLEENHRLDLSFRLRSIGKRKESYPGYCIIATHDMELVEKLKKLYVPYYFESSIEENNVTFDYLIHQGIGGESNALALLKAFGFPNEIVKDAYALIHT